MATNGKLESELSSFLIGRKSGTQGGFYRETSGGVLSGVSGQAFNIDALFSLSFSQAF